MWVLILTLQFYVYIALWQVRYTTILSFLLFEFRRIALGEFMDDLDIGKVIMEFIGISFEEKSATDEEVGDERLGSPSLFSSFGPTLILGSIALIIIAVLIIVAVIVLKRTKLSEKNLQRLKRLKKKVFFNPIVRYLLLESLKLNMSSIVVLKADEST